VPYDELADALAQPTNPQRVAAYKNALAANLNTPPSPITSWVLADIEQMLDNNDETVATAEAANTFILAVAGSYPVYFSV
jgi:hypothetical protein